MSASVRYTIDLAEIDRAFAEARRRAGSLRGLHGAIGEVLLGAVRRNVETSGDGQWPPLKPATLMARAQSAVGSGKLFKRAKGGGQTLTAGAARAVANAKPLILSAAGLFGTLRYVADESGVEAGSNKVYAAQIGRAHV